MTETFFYFAITAALLKCSFGITDEQKLRIKEEFIVYGTECIFKHPITIADVKSFKNKRFPDSSHASCFIACVFKKAGIFDDEGTLSHKTAVKKASKIIDNESDLINLHKFITVCDKVNKENVGDEETGCERAKLAFECLIENAEQFGFSLDF